MWRIERFRLFFVALIVAILATPLLTGVWLHEFKVAGTVAEERLSLELFHQQKTSSQITNRQLLLSSLATLVVAVGVMGFTRTTTHSAQTAIALALFFSALLLPYGARLHVEREEWARLALNCVPLLLLAGGVAWALLNRQDRQYQAPPWIYLCTALFLAIGYSLALYSLKDWTSLDNQTRRPISFLLLSVVGVVQVSAGLAARSYLRHRSRLATWSVVVAGLVAVLAGLLLAGLENTWPQNWWRLEVFQQQVPFPHFALPWVAVAITLLACRFQMFAFLLVGLNGLSVSIYLLGQLYFSEISTWPKLLMSLGTCCLFIALYRELRRTRGDTIDDVVRQSRL
jgi:hypothetical protein